MNRGKKQEIPTDLLDNLDKVKLVDDVNKSGSKKSFATKFALSDEDDSDHEISVPVIEKKSLNANSKKIKKKNKSADKTVKIKQDDPFSEFLNNDDQSGKPVSAAMQKKLEKKERQRLKKLEEDKLPKNETAQDVVEPNVGSFKKKKQIEKPAPVSKRVKEMQEILKREKEEVERLEKERLEMIKLEEETERKLKQEELLEAEIKINEKKLRKERIEQQKKDGTYMTPKQREQKKLVEHKLQVLREMGYQVPESKTGKEVEPKTKGFKKRDFKKKKKKFEKIEKVLVNETKNGSADCVVEKEESVSSTTADTSDWDIIKNNWDDGLDDFEKVSHGDVEEMVENSQRIETEEISALVSISLKPLRPNYKHVDVDQSLSVEERIKQRNEVDEKLATKEKLRCPIICVLGHVDTGKTKLLDKMRHTKVQEGEAGGITQQIGATNVPLSSVVEQTSMVNDLPPINIPGLLIIDTPGHESFSNLRNRGSALCDIAILVIDIMHGLEQQTKESINILKKNKIPFVIALNKIDRIYSFKSNPKSDIQDVINNQPPVPLREFKKLTAGIIAELSAMELNSCLFHDNKNLREYISIVPTSAHTGDGIGNLISLICSLTQSYLNKSIRFKEELEATVMEVQSVQGLGTTLDVIMVNGRICEGDHVVIAAAEGAIHTQVKAVLTPHPMRELRVKSAYIHHKELEAAHGLKLVCRNVESAIPGMPLYLAHYEDEIPYYIERLDILLKSVLSSYKLQEKGVFVQASTLGSLEALLEFLRASKIPYAGIGIGKIYKKDVMKASVMVERAPRWAMILAFDVMIEPAAAEMAHKFGVKLFCADIIYHLFDRFTEYQEDWTKKEKDKVAHLAVFPCKLSILPTCIFNKRQPIVMGIVVEEGSLRKNTPLVALNKENGLVNIGIVSSMELNHKEVVVANAGQEVCVRVHPQPGQVPELYGRHFSHPDLLYSKISRESIDVLKQYFRDEMKKTDWVLVKKLKTLYNII